MCLNNYSNNMNNAKVYGVFKTSDREICQICSEVDSFMVDIVNWADELGEIFENEFTAARDSSEFRLPKTPSEKRIRNRKPRNALVSKCSVLNSTVDVSHISNLNESVSTRTRSALRAATSKVSHLNITNKVKEENISVEVNRDVVDKVTEGTTDTTFIVPPSTSTRTKPVFRNKKTDVTLLETSTSITATATVNTRVTRSVSKVYSKIQIEGRETNVILKNVDQSPVERPSRKKVSRHLSESPTERPSKKKFSRNISSSPVQRQKSKSVDENAEPTTVRNNFSNPLIASPECQTIRNKLSATLIQSPVLRSSRSNGSGTPTNGPLLRSANSSLVRTSSRSPLTRSSRNNTPKVDGAKGNNGIETNKSFANKTTVIKKEGSPRVTSSFMVEDDEEIDLVIDKSDLGVVDGEKTPKVVSGRFTKISKTSTPVPEREKSSLLSISKRATVVVGDVEVTSTKGDISGSEKKKDKTYSVLAEPNSTVDESMADEEEAVPKKKRKLKKKEEETFKENIEEIPETGRITRTKSKAMKMMMEENEVKQNDLSAFAKKLVNRAKMTSLKKSQLAALLESNKSTPKSGPGSMVNYNLPFGNLTSKSKYQLLLSGSKKLKTPLATLPNSAVKIAKGSEDKDRLKPKVDYTVESLVKTATKAPKDDAIERETKLKSKKKKEEEAALKRQNVIKMKQEELKRKNELKHQLAMKQREKLEQEKHNNMIQLEREKEEKHKLILQERQMKLKEEAFKKKMLTQQKIAETGERRRLEEEARIAKLKEMEAEEQRLALEKQKEQEKQEKRAQERLAEKKAREEYELQLKQEAEAERLRAEKTKKFLSSASKLQSASKMQSASKRPKFGLLGGDKREWDYKPRNESDYGLEDENSEMDSEDERGSEKTKSPVRWAKLVFAKRSPVIRMTLEMLHEYMPCYQKSPDIHKMFKMTPSKRIKRTSSAIWNTPSS